MPEPASTDAIRDLAAHCARTRYADLPDEAIDAARICILDSIGVGLAGSTGPFVKELIESFRGGGTAGAGSRVLGQSVKLAPPEAALLNAYQIHNSEFDCVHEEAVIHTVTVLLAALLADADRRGGLSGRSLLHAVILGVDIACTLGVASTSGLRFFRPGTAGAFGAVAALGVARGHDPETLQRAFALVYAQLCGTMQAHTEGSPLLALQIGFNARNALVACDLAEAGLPGLDGVLEGPFGYFGLIEAEGDVRAIVPDLGRIWRICEVALKPWPSGRATHGIVEAVAHLRDAHAIAPEAVERIDARVPPLTHHLVGRPVNGAMDINYARLNGQYACAVMLLNGTIAIEDYTLAAIRDPKRVELARKVTIAIDSNPDPNALSPVELDMHLAGGEVLRHRIETVYGNPANPMSPAAREAKFRNCWATSAHALPASGVDGMLASIRSLEDMADVRALLDQVTGVSG